MTIKMLRFSTDDFPEHKRIDAYREIYSRTIVKHDVEPLGDRPFSFEADLRSLPGLGLASSVVSPCHRWHAAEHIDSDDLLLGVALSGGCILRQRDREAVIGQQGDAVLASAAHPVEVIIGAPSRHIALRLPRAILEAGVADLDACMARRIPSDTEGLTLLTGYLDAVRLTELTNPAICDLVVSHVYDLVALILGAKGDSRYLAQRGGARAARLAAIMREIERRSGDSGLSAVTIALLLGVTPRYVHLLLEESGKSFTHHVLERRLEKAATLLRDSRWRHRKIADVAAEAGFTDLSYFNRAFRRHFGATPSNIREAAIREGAHSRQ
jgi:AraC-like DNA-binding protein